MTSEAAKANHRYLKASLVGGAGGLVAVILFLLDQRPELARLLLERVVIAWGPLFVIVLLLFAFLYLLADRYAPRLIDAQSETALALQSLARAVEQLVAREDSFQREQDVLLNHVARRVDALHKLLESHHRRLNGHLARLAEANGEGKARPGGKVKGQRRRVARAALLRRPRRAAAAPPPSPAPAAAPPRGA